ncbi:ATP-binding protein [Bdellovibrio sp. HCB288]|uniref:sensor histidine kinase n=1 Tax=Bdellovibrio sp. HCB288 TaxID=3394355 RepID=UPI0039B5BE89
MDRKEASSENKFDFISVFDGTGYHLGDSMKNAPENYFKPRARLLRMLGEELISDEVTALIELVKNSYDADATNVSIHIDRNSKPSCIKIVDNGHGMRSSDLKGAWLELGSSSKRSTVVSPNNRPFLGKKGIGRFAADKLAKNLTIQTSTIDGKFLNQAKINFSLFDDETKYLEDIEIPIDRLPKPKDYSQGTHIFLEDLRSEFDEKLIADVKMELVKLMAPFKSERPQNFKIQFYIDNISHDLEILNKELLSKAPIKVRARVVESEDELHVEVKINGQEREPIKVPCEIGRYPGPFTVEMIVWPRDVQNLEPLISALNTNLMGARKLLDAWCGVSIYRDGFRVLPYGQNGNDWLELDKKRINTPSERISNNQILGAVFLTEKFNSSLQDLTNRQGMITNGAFTSLKDTLEVIVQEVNNFLIEQKAEDRKKKEKKPKASLLFKKTALQEMQSHIDNATEDLDRNELSHLARKAMLELQETESAVFDELSRYRRILSLGVIAARMAHEVRNQIDLIRRAADTVGQVLRKEKINSVTIREKIDSIDTAGGVINREVGRLQPFVRSRRKIENVNLKVLIEDIVKQLEDRIEDSAVTVDLKLDSQMIVKSDYGEVFQVFYNLLDNSLFWLKNRQEAKIKVIGRIEETQVKIKIADNGPGVANQNTDYIFEPFWSTKPDGSGLGLPIAGEILADYGGELALESGNGGAVFVVTLPLLGG